MTTINEKLTARYLEILAEYEDLLMTLTQDKHYGKLFLTYAPDDYEHAEHKVFIVGRETRGWSVAYEEGDSLTQYIGNSMEKSRFWVEHPKGSNSYKRGNGFFTFFRKVAERCGKQGILWGNIYALSFTRTPNRKVYNWHPKSSEYFVQIEALSEALFLTQLEILQPDIVIFAGGNASNISRRKYLGQDGGKNIGSQVNYSSIADAQLCRFKLDNGTICYRIQHPSSFSRKNKRARDYLLKELLPKAGK